MWARGVSATVVGLVLVGAGFGVGVPHALKTGASPGAVLGLTALVAGLALLAVGWFVVVRATVGWWRLVTVPLLVLSTYVVLWSLSQAVAATTVPRTDVEGRTPSAAGLAYRNVSFSTRDGVRLSGWYVPGDNGAAVALLHGAGSTRSAVLDQAAVLARHGYGVLLFDARGHGRSAGRAMDFGWHGDADLSAAVSFLAARPDVRDGRIAALGLSMGGEEAIGAAAMDPRIRAVVAEGATNRVAGDKAWLPHVYGVRGWFQRGIDWLTYGLADLLSATAPPVTLHDAAASAAPRPMLLIVAGKEPDELHAGRFIRSASPRTVRLWVVPDARHTEGLRTRPVAWERTVVGFLDQAMTVYGDITAGGVPSTAGQRR